MEETVEMNKNFRIGTIPSEAMASTTNAKVKKVLERMEDKSFLDRICSYSETYWDHHHSQNW